MSDALDLLNGLSDEEIAMYTAGNDTTEEPHIVIHEDRSVEVPVELTRIGVQHDHNIETVIFDCPRYWDEHDMSTMAIYINYKRADNHMASYPAYDISVDETDENIMHFKWTVERDVTDVKGKLAFLVCAKKVSDTGDLVNHWSSELCTDMYISEGMECDLPDVTDTNPDFVTLVLQRLSVTEQMVNGFNTRLNELAGVAGDLGNLRADLDKAEKKVIHIETVILDQNTTVREYVEQNLSSALSYDKLPQVYFIYRPNEEMGDDIVNSKGSAILFCSGENGVDGPYIGQLLIDRGMIMTRAGSNTYGWSEWDYPALKSFVDKTFVDHDARIYELEKALYPPLITEIPEILVPSTSYNFGEVAELTLNFPHNSSGSEDAPIAKDGDVIYITFKSGETPTVLTMTDTGVYISDFDLVPEANKGYEIFGKFNGSIWILGYSEYTFTPYTGGFGDDDLPSVEGPEE